MGNASDKLRQDLNEILLSSMSYPLIQTTRSDPSHRLCNNLFVIKLKQKLHLEIFDPKCCPTCLCGKTIDPFDMQIFCCQRVSKKVTHNRICDGIALVFQKILLNLKGGCISQGSKMEIVLEGAMPDLPGLGPFGLAFRQATLPKHTHLST